MANVYGLREKYDPCDPDDPIGTIVIVIQIASLILYIIIWRIDITFSVIAGNYIRKIIWVIAARILILIIGASFVRLIFIRVDEACYCSDNELSVAINFNLGYLAALPILWILYKIQAAKWAMIVLTYIYSKYICCESVNCCIEIVIESKKPTGPVGKGANAIFKPIIKGIKKVISLIPLSMI